MVINETFSLEKMFSKLQLKADNHKIEILEWPKNNLIFKYYNVREFKEKGNEILTKLNIMLLEPITTIFTDDEKQKLMIIYHSDPLSGGHCGMKKLYAKLRNKYYWKNMTRDIAKFVKNCSKCTVNKPKISNKEELVLTETPAKPFDIVIMDTIGPLPMSGLGNKFALTLICDLSKYLVTIPIPIFEGFILIYGVMKRLRTDQGTEFKNEVIQELCKLLKIEHTFSTPHHHESVSTVERNHRIFNEYLRAYLSETDSDWDTYVQFFTFYHNTTENTVFDFKFTPYELVFGKKATVPIEINDKIDPIYNIDSYVQETKYRFQKSHLLARTMIERHKQSSKKYFDLKANPISIKEKELVLIEKQPYDKHRAIYDGPFAVESIDVTVI